MSQILLYVTTQNQNILLGIMINTLPTIEIKVKTFQSLFSSAC